MIESRVLPNLTSAFSSERRLSQRLTVAAQIELRIKGSSVPIRSKTTDLSVGGWYIEMAVTLEPGTPLDVVLWLEHERLVLQGRIVTKHPRFGDGIEFICVSPEAETCLQRFLEKAE